MILRNTDIHTYTYYYYYYYSVLFKNKNNVNDLFFVLQQKDSTTRNYFMPMIVSHLKLFQKKLFLPILTYLLIDI